MAKMLDGSFEVNGFELWSRYCVYFRTWEKYEPLLSVMGYIVPLPFFFKDGFGIKQPAYESWYIIKE